MLRRAVIGLALSWLAWNAAGALPTAADLLRRPEVVRAHLAPDGRHVVLVSGDEHGSLTLFDVASGTRSPLKVTLGVRSPAVAPVAVTDARWIGATRLLLRANITRLPPSITVLGPVPTGVLRGPSRGFNLPPSYSGFSAIDITGKQLVDLPGIAQRTDSIPGTSELPFTWDARQIFFPAGQPGIIYAPAHEGRPGPHPLLAKIDTLHGTASRVLGNPGTITEWLPDPTGRVVLGIEGGGATTTVLTREKNADHWAQVADLGTPRKRLRLEALDAQRGLIYASRLTPEGRWVLSAFNIAQGKWMDAFVQSPTYDVAPAESRSMYADFDLTDLVFSPKSGRLIAFGLVTDGPRQAWLDDRLRGALQQLQASDPESIHYAVELDDAETQLLTFSWSSREPGFYSMVDLATKKATRVADRLPGLDPVSLGEMFPARFKARDGAELDAYVTFPPGAAKKQLPLVLLVREHPWQRDIWGFQPQVQWLAAHGFAVLQVNHRGSTGYGEAFARAGRDDIDGVMLNDLIDATRWAIAQGTADPTRVGVVGTSFGGYAALLALDREPELFRCGAAIQAVTDWTDIFRRKDTSAYRYWFGSIDVLPGARTEERLRQASPHTLATHFRGPLLLVHDEGESRTPVRGAKALAAALKKENRPVETFFYDIDRFDRQAAAKKQIQIYERTAAFLARHLATPPGSPPAPAKK